jgi:hypothetical protein
VSRAVMSRPDVSHRYIETICVAAFRRNPDVSG